MTKRIIIICLYIIRRSWKTRTILFIRGNKCL